MAQNYDDVLVVLEEVSRVNKQLVNENRVLKENLEKRDQEQKKILADLHQKLEQVTSGKNGSQYSRRSHTKTSQIKVPAPCRRITRQVYNTLMKKDDFGGFILTESIHSEGNRVIVETVVTEIFAQFSGADKTPWSRVVIEAALKRYFVSQYELDKQKSKGKYEQHKKNCRRHGRKKDKLTKRTLALEKAYSSTKKRGKAAEILVEDAMSSEESCVEEDENGRNKVVGYKVRRLSWESSKLKRIKKALDKTMREGQSQRARDRALPRTEHEEKSTRLPPEGFPKWAISQE